METKVYLFEKLFKQYIAEQTDPAAVTPVNDITWKELSKQGYEQVMGSKPLEKSTKLYDANITAVGGNISAADMALQKLLRDRKIFAWSQIGQILHRKTETGAIEAKFVSMQPL